MATGVGGGAADPTASVAADASAFITPAHKANAAAAPASLGYVSGPLDARRTSPAELRRATEDFRMHVQWNRHHMADTGEAP